MAKQYKTEAHRFFGELVAPAIADWRMDETELHKAMTVATNLAHMVDYFWQSYNKIDPAKVYQTGSVKQFRDALANHYPEFAIIRDVCDAHKHMKLDRGDRQVTSADQSTTGNMGWGEGKWNEARWGSPEEIIVTDDSGEKHHFIALVDETEKMWASLLN